MRLARVYLMGANRSPQRAVLWDIPLIVQTSGWGRGLYRHHSRTPFVILKPLPLQLRRCIEYACSAQLSLLPLADPATDGQRVYATDNRGVVMAVDIKTGGRVGERASSSDDSARTQR